MSSFGYNVLGFGSFANRAIKVEISSDVNNPDIDGGSYFGATAWASGTPKVLNITSGTTVGNLVIPGSMGGTLTINNAGNIHGSAGSGGSAGSSGAGGSGGDGGVAITSASSFIYKGQSGSNLLGGGGGGGGGGKAGNKSVTNNSYVRQPSSGNIYGPGNYNYAIRNQKNQSSGVYQAKWAGQTITNAIAGPNYVQYYYHSPHGYTYYRGSGHKLGQWNFGIYRAGQFSSTTNYTGGAGGAGGAGAGYGSNAASGQSGTDGPGPAGAGGAGGDGGALGAGGEAGSTGAPPSGSSGGSAGSAGASITFSSGSLTLAQDDGTITPDP